MELEFQVKSNLLHSSVVSEFPFLAVVKLKMTGYKLTRGLNTFLRNPTNSAPSGLSSKVCELESHESSHDFRVTVCCCIQSKLKTRGK